MNFKKLVFCFVLLTSLCMGSYSQGKIRIAVLPFTNLGTSEKDAQVVSTLFETALVKTMKFQIIEQTQAKKILETWEYSLSGVTDDKTAIEFGRLLTAERIVLGELSTIGESYVLNVKIIDIESGRNVRADNISASSLDDFPESTENLAYSIAGMTREEVESQYGRYDKIVQTLGSYSQSLNGEPENIDAITIDLRTFLSEIRSSGNSLMELEAETNELLIRAEQKEKEMKNDAALANLYAMKDSLKKELEELDSKRKKMSTMGFIIGGAGIALAGGSVAFYMLGDSAYENYQAATITADADTYREQTQLYNGAFYGSAGIGAAGIIGGIIYLLTKPNRDTLENRLYTIDIEIAQATGGSK